MEMVGISGEEIHKFLKQSPLRDEFQRVSVPLDRLNADASD